MLHVSMVIPLKIKKHKTCDTIINLYNSKYNDKWLLFGDFNLYINSSEKLGGKNVDYNLCDLFSTTLYQCELLDLGYHDNKYTWGNNQESEHHIKECLVKFRANDLWITHFPIYINYHFLRFTFDHSPILLELWDKHICRSNCITKQKIP